MARKSGFVRRGGSMRRETMWVGIGEVDQVLAAANTAVLIQSSNAALLALRPFTVVRSHITWFAGSDQTAAQEAWQVAFGVAVVSDQATAIGVTAVPTPFTDLGSDLFFVHQVQAGRFIFISGVGVEPLGGRQIQIDSKAMRKVNDDQDIVFVLENSGVSLGSRNITAGRMLIKLH